MRPKAPYLQINDKTPAPRLIYTNISQNHYSPFRRKIRGGELLLFTNFFPKPKRIYENLDNLKIIRIFNV